jgi:hypothetical protein
MLCPYCSAPIDEHVTDYGDHACGACGLCGPRDTLQALAARLSPAQALAEAESLLRERGVQMVSLLASGGVALWGADCHKVTGRGGLAEAVERLEKERQP